MCPANAHASPSHSSSHPKIKCDLFPFCEAAKTMAINRCTVLTQLRRVLYVFVLSSILPLTCFCSRSDSISANWSISSCSGFAGVVVDFAIFVLFAPISCQRVYSQRTNTHSTEPNRERSHPYLIDGVARVSMAITYFLLLRCHYIRLSLVHGAYTVAGALNKRRVVSILFCALRSKQL